MSDHITVVGTIVNDPERRRTAAGDTVVNFRLASNIRRRDESGAWNDRHTNWYAVSAYRGLAEHALESLRKGNRVIVTGTFKLREWDSGERQGVSAEIEAAALGHDLLWGTTVFRRDESASSRSSTPETPPLPSVPPAQADAEWGRPQTPAPEHGSDTQERGVQAETGSSWAPLVEEPTPF